MRLVNNEDAVARFGRRVVGAIAQLAHVLHAVVRGGVELRHVQVARASGARETQESHLPHGVEVGPCSQLSERAIIRAEEVLPQPRGPEKR